MEEFEQLTELNRRVFMRCMFSVSVAVAMLGRTSPARAETVPAPDLSRIVAVGGTVTEILFALGLGEAIVGVDTSSVYPATTDPLPRVGYQRTLAAEGILSLRPTAVITTEDAGPPPVLQQLREVGVGVFPVTAKTTLDGARERIRQLGRLTGRSDQADELIRDLDNGLKASSPDISKTRVVFVYARGAGTLNVSGQETPADEMIRLAGGVNAVSTFTGFRPLTAESLVAAAPDVLLFTDRGLASIGGVAGVQQLPGVELTPAGKSGRIIAMDDLLLLGFGLRTAIAVSELSRRLEGNGSEPEARNVPRP